MPGIDQSIPSSLVEVFAVPPGGGAPVLLGIVEQFNATEQPASENLLGIGHFVAPDSVVNNTQGRVSWGRVHTINPTLLAIIRPVASRFATYKAFDLLAVDPSDGKPIFYCRGVLPESLDTQVANGRALRENYNGICREVLRGDEINQQ